MIDEQHPLEFYRLEHGRGDAKRTMSFADHVDARRFMKHHLLFGAMLYDASNVLLSWLPAVGAKRDLDK